MGSWFRFHPRRSRTTQGGAFGAEPKVRIHLPPAESLSLAPSRSRTWRTPAFSAGVRGWLGGFGLEIDWATRPSDPYENHVMDGEANDPNFDFQCKKRVISNSHGTAPASGCWHTASRLIDQGSPLHDRGESPPLRQSTREKYGHTLLRGTQPRRPLPGGANTIGRLRDPRDVHPATRRARRPTTLPRAD